MLVLTRSEGQVIYAGEVKIVVTRIDRGRVRLGIEAPDSMSIVRGELVDEDDHNKGRDTSAA